MLEKKSAEEECPCPVFLLRTSRDRQVLSHLQHVYPYAQIVCIHSLTVEGCPGLGLSDLLPAFSIC